MNSTRQRSTKICWLLAVGCWLLVVGCWLLAIGYWLLAVGYWSFVGTRMTLISKIYAVFLQIPQPSAFYELTEGKFTQIVLAFCVFYSSTHTFNCCAMPIRGRKLATRNPQLTSTSTSTSTSISTSTSTSISISISISTSTSTSISISTSTSTSFPFTISTQRSLVIIIFSIKIRRFYTNCVILTKLLKCRNGNS